MPEIAPEIELPLQQVVTRQIRLQGSCCTAGSYPEAIRLVADGTIDAIATDHAPHVRREDGRLRRLRHAGAIPAWRAERTSAHPQCRRAFRRFAYGPDRAAGEVRQARRRRAGSPSPAGRPSRAARRRRREGREGREQSGRRQEGPRDEEEQEGAQDGRRLVWREARPPLAPGHRCAARDPQVPEVD